MAELEPKTILDTIEIIRAVKSLVAEQNPYLPVYSALGGAFIGAVSSFFPNYLINRIKERNEKRSTTLQIYAEVKATLELADHRKYIEQLERICAALRQQPGSSSTYQIQVPEDRYIVFNNSLPRLGTLDVDLQVKVVEFYQLLEAVIQDVKPGGLLNVPPVPLEAFEEVIRISKRARQLGDEILAIVEKRCRVPN